MFSSIRIKRLSKDKKIIYAVKGKPIINDILVMGYKNICKWYDVCPLKRFYERNILNKKWVNDYCWGDYLKCARYKMEDKGTYHPDNMLPDGTIDENLE